YGQKMESARNSQRDPQHEKRSPDRVGRELHLPAATMSKASRWCGSWLTSAHENSADDTAGSVGFSRFHADDLHAITQGKAITHLVSIPNPVDFLGAQILQLHLNGIADFPGGESARRTDQVHRTDF